MKKIKMRITRMIVKHKLVHKHQLFLNPASVPESFCFTLTAAFLFSFFDEFCVFLRINLLYILLASKRSSSDRKYSKHKGRIKFC